MKWSKVNPYDPVKRFEKIQLEHNCALSTDVNGVKSFMSKSRFLVCLSSLEKTKLFRGDIFC
jgi:hypothetical protein